VFHLKYIVIIPIQYNIGITFISISRPQTHYINIRFIFMHVDTYYYYIFMSMYVILCIIIRTHRGAQYNNIIITS